MFREVDGAEMGHAKLCAEADCLLLHVLDEFRALDALGPAGKVFDQRGDGELRAGLVAFKDQRFEVGACSVDGCGKSGAAGAEDDSVARRVFRHMNPYSVNARGRKKMQQTPLVQQLRLWQI